MTNKQKPRCKFYGCLIPQDVPHRHPFGKPVVIEPTKPWFVLVQKKAAPVKRLSFPQLIGKMATRFALGIGLVLLAVYFICAIAGVGIMMVEWAPGTQVKL